MRITRQTYLRISLVCFILTFVLLIAGCNTNWVSQATSIVNLLIPSITSLLGIIAAFGAGLSPNIVTQVQQLGAKAAAGLQEVGSLIDQYNTAEATAQPGIIQEINTALGVVNQNLAQIEPLLNIADATTKAKIQAVVNAIIAEVGALTNLVPAIQGKVTSHEELKALVAQLKSAKEYKTEFNGLVEPFGETYKI